MNILQKGQLDYTLRDKSVSRSMQAAPYVKIAQMVNPALLGRLISFGNILGLSNIVGLSV